MSEDVSDGAVYRLTFWTGTRMHTAYVRGLGEAVGAEDGPVEWLPISDRVILEARLSPSMPVD